MGGLNVDVGRKEDINWKKSQGTERATNTITDFAWPAAEFDGVNALGIFCYSTMSASFKGSFVFRGRNNFRSKRGSILSMTSTMNMISLC